MLELTRRHPGAFALALLAHAGLFGLLVGFSLLRPPRQPIAAPQVDIVQATAVDQAQVDKEVERLKDAERARQEALDRERQAQAQERREQEEAARKAAAARRQEEQRLAALRKQQAEEQKHQQELAAQKQAEQERLADLQRKKAALEAQRKAEEQRVAKLEAQRKAEEQRRAEAERQRKEEEARRQKAEQARKKAEAARQRQLEQERKRREHEEALKREMAAEQARIEKQQAAQRQSEINKYVALIKAAVKRNWLVPPNTAPGTACDVVVNLIPSGDVVGVRLKNCSGGSVFQRSVENAVRKASPLPVPSVESGLFDEFRRLPFKFTPEPKG